MRNIKPLIGWLSANAIEKMIQNYLTEDFWLLGPSWPRAGDSRFVEQRLATAFEGINENLDPHDTQWTN